MVIETENRPRVTGLNKSNEEISEKKRKSIETYSIIALFILIAAVLLISFNLQLLAGCLIIAGASYWSNNQSEKFLISTEAIKNLLTEFSSLNERKMM